MNFQVDENVTIGSILKAIRAGNKAEHIAKAIDGISQKPFLQALKDAGYEYSNKAPKGWHYVGEGAEPLETSIFDYVKRGNIKVKSSSPKVISSNTEVTTVSSIAHPQFTRDEVTDLMDMLQEWRMNKAAEQMGIKEPKAVHERIKELPQGDKTRKTVVIDKGIGERLDKYCQAEKVNKSDILHLALMDFLDKQG